MKLDTCSPPSYINNMASFENFQAELANLPNCVKIKNSLNILVKLLKLKFCFIFECIISIFILRAF